MDEPTRQAIEWLLSQSFRVVVTSDDWREQAKAAGAGSQIDDCDTWVDLVHVSGSEPLRGYGCGPNIEAAIQNAAQRLRTEG